MAYSLNRRCGPGSGIRHGPIVLNPPVRPAPTAEQLAADLRRKANTARKRARNRRRDTEARQLGCFEAFAEFLSTPGYAVGERKELGIRGNPKKGGVGTSKRQRRRQRNQLRFSGALRCRRREFIRREVQR